MMPLASPALHDSKMPTAKDLAPFDECLKSYDAHFWGEGKHRKASSHSSFALDTRPPGKASTWSRKEIIYGHSSKNKAVGIKQSEEWVRFL
jgi:hypothetical protein